MIADMSATRQHPADTHDWIRVRGARQNNLTDISVELPKRRLTVFTGVSGSGKSSLLPARVTEGAERRSRTPAEVRWEPSAGYQQSGHV